MKELQTSYDNLTTSLRDFLNSYIRGQQATRKRKDRIPENIVIDVRQSHSRFNAYNKMVNDSGGNRCSGIMPGLRRKCLRVVHARLTQLGGVRIGWPDQDSWLLSVPTALVMLNCEGLTLEMAWAELGFQTTIKK